MIAAIICFTILLLSSLAVAALDDTNPDEQETDQ